MAEETVASNTTDDRALNTASLIRTNGATDQHRDGTLVEIGGGVFLTAGHVMYQYVNPGEVRSADSYTFQVGEGLDTNRDVTVQSADFNFTNGGWGTEGGSDMAFGMTNSAASVDMPMIVYADPNDAAGSLETFGFPTAGGYDGETMVKVTGTLTANAHQTISTGNGDMTVLVSNIGMQIYSGFSGAGVWLTNDVDGDGQQETYLAGVVSLDVQYVGGLHATGFEPMADIYAELAVQIGAAGIPIDSFARATLVSGQSLGSANTEVTGTRLHEDLIGGQNADTLNAWGGNDILEGFAGSDTLDGGKGRDQLFGGDGADVLIDGLGRDRMTGGDGADTYELSADRKWDRVLDFEDGTDTIDISAWGTIGFGELTITDHASGRVHLRYYKETLVLDDGARGLRAADVTADDFIFSDGTRIVVNGTADGEKMIGTSAAEEIHDGAGADRLIGRQGSDLFVFAADGDVDAIKDFADGADLMDVRAWGATTFDDLTVETHRAGKVVITYADEILILNDWAKTLDATDISADDFVFA